MGFFSKIFTAVRGKAHEVAESVEDNQAIRILEQEMRDAQAQLKSAKESLTTIKAKRKLAENSIKDLDKSIKEYETYARLAAEKEDQENALDCAQRVSELRAEKDKQSEYLAKYKQGEAVTQQNIKKASDRLKHFEQEIDLVKANDSVIKAQEAAASSNLNTGSKLKTASDSLDRLKNKQQLRQAEIESASEMEHEESGASLDDKLKEAGIMPGGKASAEDELSRILGK